MKDFVEYLVKNLLPEGTQGIIVDETRNGTEVRVNITVPQEYMGAIIGKRGRVIKALRALVRAKAIKDSVKVIIELNELNGIPQPGNEAEDAID
jgi:predicted RNA-binding protein YlqC (UPF0109 family)